MSVDESRRPLHDAAREAWGSEAALALMEMLPPSGWGDVATRQQLEAVEERLDLRIDALDDRLGHRIESVETRLDAKIDLVASRLDSAIERGMRRALQWNVATIIAVAGVTTAIARIG